MLAINSKNGTSWLSSHLPIPILVATEYFMSALKIKPGDIKFDSPPNL